jgi:putative transposase
VWRQLNRPTIVFLTVCTQRRRPYLANERIHSMLVEVWRDAAAWRVGRYVLMPDHIHLFAGPASRTIPFDNWVRYWKSQFTRRCGLGDHRWQPDHWDRTLRNGESYEEKWKYVRDNPVRHGLVQDADDWPFQGELNQLAW